jgi:hypothetical protein
MLGYLYEKRFGSKNAGASRKAGDVVGQVQEEIQAVEGNGSHTGHRYICDGDTAPFRGEEGEPLDGIVLTIVFQVAVCFP